MRRLQLIRWALLALLVPFLVLLALQFRPKPPPTTAAGDAGIEGPKAGRASRIEWKLLDKDVEKYIARVETAEQGDDGSIVLRGIENLEIHREGRDPLRLDAAYGTVLGPSGRRIFNLSGGVVLRDEAAGFRFEVRELVMEESKEEARSVGGVRFSTPRYEGRADRIVYGLADAPSTLTNLRFGSEQGDRFEAARAIFHDALKDVEFVGAVRVRHAGGRLESDRLRVWRDGEDRLERVFASGNVDGTLPLPDGDAAQIRGSRLDLRWSEEDGTLASIRLEGGARVVRTLAALSAQTIECMRDAGVPGGWSIAASEAVEIDAPIRGESSSLDADHLVAQVRGAGDLHEAQASGRVRFASGATRAEADLMEILPPEPAPPDGRIVLTATGRAPARLLQEDARVRARRISTDPAGERLVASERVEVTLLPSESADSRAGVFRGDEAVHFVAADMTSLRRGERIVLTGAVRGWQGSRTLSADRVTIDEDAGALEAVGAVSTRLPRRSGGRALAEADFANVRGASLRYDDGTRVAVFDGGAEVLQDEGRLESERLTVRLDANGDVDLAEGDGDVSFEFSSTDRDGKPAKFVGSGDRFVYRPGSRTVELIGRTQPASVERFDDVGGRTEGRTIQYFLAEGRYEVTSGDQDRVRIRSTGGSR